MLDNQAVTGKSFDTSISVAPGVVVPSDVLTFTYARSSGPGGQNVNKLNTKATLVVRLADLAEVMPGWAIDRLQIIARGRLSADGERLILYDGSTRSQHANRQACLAKLRALLIEAMYRPRRRRPTKPSRAAVQRRLDAKHRRALTKANRRKPPIP
ncbi:MAG: alternative ribosome rescue aminoacyl-tRNA hydrolase ArfB [Phycisphaeraceae bacterium]